MKVLLSLFLIFLCLSVVYLECVVNPLIVSTAKQSIFSLSTSAVSDAVYEVLSTENLTYDDLVTISYDSDGNVKLINLETIKMNLIARQFYKVAQVYLDEMGKNGVGISVGAFTGLPFLAGLGPKINIKLENIGAMTSTFESVFTSAGINQTNHAIYIRLYASVNLLLPAYRGAVDSVTEMLVAESVIVGKVPEVYLGQNSTFDVL